MYLSVT